DRGVCHDRRQLDERLDTAETLRDLKDVQTHQNPARLRQPSLHLKGDDPAEAVHLSSGDIMAWVVGQPGIVDPAYAWMILQELRDLDRVLFVLPHAQRQCLHPSEREKAIEG